MKIKTAFLLLTIFLVASATLLAQATRPLTVQVTTYPPAFARQIELKNLPMMQVAILSSKTFDARTVNPSTLIFSAGKLGLLATGGATTCHLGDANLDEVSDLVCPMQSLRSTTKPGAATIVVEGRTYDGVRIRGEVSLNIVANEEGAKP